MQDVAGVALGLHLQDRQLPLQAARAPAHRHAVLHPQGEEKLPCSN